MESLRTPDAAFDSLPDWPYEPRYVELPDGLRIAYVDEGPPDGAVVLLMHGEPSWSYLYRFMIPALIQGGCRVLAPDLVGFGRSDKPTEQSAHTYERHVEWMLAWIREVNPSDVTFFGQDWGGLIGLRLVTTEPDRFAAVVVANTGLPTGDNKATDAFMAWQKFSRTVQTFPVGVIVNGGTSRDLAPAEVAAYDAPFPTEQHKAGPRQLPSMVPTDPDNPSSAANRAAWQVLRSWTKPFVCAFSDSDPITKGGERVFLRDVPGAQGQAHLTTSGGHFLQEDCGPELAALILRTVHLG